MRAAGLNFRDVVVALGAIADEGLGGEAAGVVIDTAPDVTALRPGDAVMGMFPNNAFSPTAITDHRLVVAIPPGGRLPRRLGAGGVFDRLYRLGRDRGAGCRAASA